MVAIIFELWLDLLVLAMALTIIRTIADLIVNWTPRNKLPLVKSSQMGLLPNIHKHILNKHNMKNNSQ